MSAPPDPGDIDLIHMRAALELAEQGRGSVEPNPLVGCLLVRGGDVIGTGFHAKFGGPHAEIAALNSLSAADAHDATAYVTLEPCCHTGKTPPCTAALIQAGIKRVVVAMEDPFAKVTGNGIKQLRDAGIDTTVGLLREQAELLNAPYLKRIRSGRPWVIAKWAMTLDGRIATAGGESQWITGDASRQEVHRLRGRVDAIAVGMGTVRTDDPMLTARPAGPRTATRVVFCARNLPDPKSKLVQSAGQTPVCLIVSKSLSTATWDEIESRGVEILRCQTDDSVELVDQALQHLGQREMTNLMVEGGGRLLASFFAARQIDECHVYVGPMIFGGQNAPGPVAGRGVQRLSDALSMELVSVDRLGGDIRLIYSTARRLAGF